MSTNPFLTKKFYLYESNKETTTSSVLCPSFTGTSTIKSSQQQAPTNTTLKSDNSMSALDINNYILQLVQDFATDSSLAKRCDVDSRYKGSYRSDVTCCSGSSIQSICSDKFKVFKDASYKPNSDYYSGAPNTGPAKLVLSNFIYNDTGKKSLCQQYNDISGLLTDFSNVVLGSMKNEISSYNTTSTDNFKKNYADMISLRNTVDLQLQNILHKNNTTYEQNKLQLDSTVYTSVLWTVLATSVLYYVFIKI